VREAYLAEQAKAVMLDSGLIWALGVSMRCLQILLMLATVLFPFVSAQAVSGMERSDMRVVSFKGAGGTHALPAGSHKKSCTCPKAGVCSSQTFALEGSYGFVCDLHLAAVMRPLLSAIEPGPYSPELEPPPPRRLLC